MIDHDSIVAHKKNLRNGTIVSIHSVSPPVEINYPYKLWIETTLKWADFYSQELMYFFVARGLSFMFHISQHIILNIFWFN